MILGHFYNIKPLFSTFRELLLYVDEYRDVIQFKKSIKPSWQERYYIRDHLHYLGKKFKDECILSRIGGPWYYQITGRPFMMGDLLIKGDFSLYEEFRGTLDVTDDTGNGLMANTFGMIALFMRLDLAENFRAKDFFFGARETLLYLLDPPLLTQLKDDLRDAMIPLTAKDEYEFDLINNARYHPKNRIKFLSKLAFSAEFSYWNLRVNISEERYVYLRLRELINKMYDSFDYFCTKWQLTMYLDIGNDEEEQRRMHNDFKSIIQCIFGMCDYYLYSDHEKTGFKTICQSAQAHAESRLFSVCTNGKLFDVLPKDENELIALIDFMANKPDEYSTRGEDSLVQNLQRPWIDGWFQRRTGTQGGEMRFDRVNDIYLFFCKIWHVAFDVT